MTKVITTYEIANIRIHVSAWWWFSCPGMLWWFRYTVAVVRGAVAAFQRNAATANSSADYDAT